jgi:uncharacterized protein
VLTGEENIWLYFTGKLDALSEEALRSLHARYRLGTGRYGWERYHARFDLTKEPHEPNRFGWVVEIDPYNPQSMPVKHTAMGRMAHEGATIILAKDGRPVAYMGDDARFEYLYKFVATDRYDPGNRQANMQLLDSGTLSVARFRDDGSGEWLPLTYGQGPLTEANGFRSQAEVVINTRRAADLLGATKMDRPEDVEPNPLTGKVYCVMTGNANRTPEQVDKANPRPQNKFGHIIELTEDGGTTPRRRFAGRSFCWPGTQRIRTTRHTTRAARTSAPWRRLTTWRSMTRAGCGWQRTEWTRRWAQTMGSGSWRRQAPSAAGRASFSRARWAVRSAVRPSHRISGRFLWLSSIPAW